jgi:hypothetical protein
VNCFAKLAFGLGVLLPGSCFAVEDEAIYWNNIGLRIVKSAMIPPPLIARNLAISSIAQFDASAAVRRTRVSYIYRGMTDEVGVPEDAAISAAAYYALKGAFPEQAHIAEEAWRRRLPELRKKKHWYEAKRIGEEAARAILRARADDGSKDSQYTDPGGTEIGQWRPVKILEEPDLKRFEPSVLPGWKYVRPFAIPDSRLCWPEGSIKMDGPEYAEAVEEVRLLGGRNSTIRTPEQTLIAQFWQGQGGTLTPVGQWNDLATRAAVKEKRTLHQNLLMYAVLNVALADAGISSWDFKYATRMWRPQTAIREADKDDNPGTQVDPTWRSLIVTPNHPSCVSGHSAFSAAGAEVLKACFGQDDLEIVVASDSTKNWQTRIIHGFTNTAKECGRSRIYGGIHFEFDNTMGQELGSKVAKFVLSQPWVKASLD